MAASARPKVTASTFGVVCLSLLALGLIAWGIRPDWILGPYSWYKDRSKGWSVLRPGGCEGVAIAVQNDAAAWPFPDLHPHSTSSYGPGTVHFAFRIPAGLSMASEAEIRKGIAGRKGRAYIVGPDGRQLPVAQFESFEDPQLRAVAFPAYYTPDVRHVDVKVVFGSDETVWRLTDIPKTSTVSTSTKPSRPVMAEAWTEGPEMVGTLPKLAARIDPRAYRETGWELTDFAVEPVYRVNRGQPASGSMTQPLTGRQPVGIGRSDMFIADTPSVRLTGRFVRYETFDEIVEVPDVPVGQFVSRYDGSKHTALQAKEFQTASGLRLRIVPPSGPGEVVHASGAESKVYWRIELAGDPTTGLPKSMARAKPYVQWRLAGTDGRIGTTIFDPQPKPGVHYAKLSMGEPRWFPAGAKRTSLRLIVTRKEPVETDAFDFCLPSPHKAGKQGHGYVSRDTVPTQFSFN